MPKCGFVSNDEKEKQLWLVIPSCFRWFTNCWSSYLNGAYYNTSSPPYNGISWREWKEEQLYK